MREITKISDFRIIRTQEKVDAQAPNNKKNRQFRIRVYFKNKQIKTSYFPTKRDQLIGYNLLITPLKVLIDKILKEPVSRDFSDNCNKENSK